MSEGAEFLQLSYFCGIDSDEDIAEKLRSCIGSLKDIGTAQSGRFTRLGIFPVFLCYERNGKTVRSMENDTGYFRKVRGNIYAPVDGNATAAFRLGRQAA